MPAPDAPRLLLFADGSRATGADAPARLRRYRLGRLRPAPGPGCRPDSEPRYASPKRSGG